VLRLNEHNTSIRAAAASLQVRAPFDQSTRSNALIVCHPVSGGEAASITPEVLTRHLFFASVGASTCRAYERETPMTAMFVNLPVTDLERSKAFYTAIGFTINPLFTDHNAACVVVEDDHSYFMILVRDYFQTFTELPIGDPAVNPSVSTAIFFDNREAVDKAVADGIAAGGSEPRPASDYGFMYQRQLNDPDGNILEFGWMDPVAAEQGPEAFMNQQA
jgi:uncharacterized protein